ncbi:MAG: hypothetical protein K0S01_3389 [Herbinix sp.]|jgi:cyclic lactone autoinducer peptide|nr:hypothetical protein [Herbinix sp.]
MEKMIKKLNQVSSNSCKAVLTLSVAALETWGPGCSLLFYEPKEPKNLKNINLKKLRKELK